MTFNKEPDFEKALITLLFDKGWEPEVIKYPTEADLIQLCYAVLAVAQKSAIHFLLIWPARLLHV